MKQKHSIIDCGTPSDAKLAIMAMFRYAFGRRTYMPSAVIGIIKRNSESLGDITLGLLDRELGEAAVEYERLYKGKRLSNYGDECDRAEWTAFHEWVKSEIAKRKAT
jgi:hypothetical protein